MKARLIWIVVSEIGLIEISLAGVSVIGGAKKKACNTQKQEPHTKLGNKNRPKDHHCGQNHRNTHHLDWWKVCCQHHRQIDQWPAKQQRHSKPPWIEPDGVEPGGQKLAMAAARPSLKRKTKKRTAATRWSLRFTLHLGTLVAIRALWATNMIWHPMFEKQKNIGPIICCIRKRSIMSHTIPTISSAHWAHRWPVARLVLIKPPATSVEPKWYTQAFTRLHPHVCSHQHANTLPVDLIPLWLALWIKDVWQYPRVSSVEGNLTAYFHDICNHAAIKTETMHSVTKPKTKMMSKVHAMANITSCSAEPQMTPAYLRMLREPFGCL